MKVGFYLENNNYIGIDFSVPQSGNPGIGGSEYIVWTISCYLNQIYNDLDIILFAPITDKLPNNIEAYKCSSLEEAIEFSEKINLDIFVFRGPQNNKELFELIDRKKIKSVMWNHNYENYQALKYASECSYLVRNVCVSREQYDKLRDHKIFIKSSYIFNALDFSLYEGYKKEPEHKENIVGYMGSLVHDKGFHILAQNWKKILAKVPDAKLYVIGSGKLYNSNSKLGKYKLTNEEYEEQFINYILDENGQVMGSVNFLGVLGGREKLQVMSKCKVGVANPTASGETFCIVGVEFQAIGVPVVSKKKYGLLDTICNNKSGILINKEEDLADAIINLLKDNEKNKCYGDYGEKFVREKFDINKICTEWEKLFIDIMENKKTEPIYKTKNYFNDLKWLREINRKISKVFNTCSLIELRAKINKIIKFNNMKDVS